MPFKNEIPMKLTLPRITLCILGWKLKFNIFCLYKERAQPSQHEVRKHESKSLSEFLTMSTLVDESQFQETFISSQSFFLKQTIWKATLMMMFS